MVLSMSRPWKHPKTGVYYLRKAVPKSLREVVGRDLVKVTLGTKDPAEAKRLHALKLAELEREWARLQSVPADLTHRELRALAGRWYAWFVARYEDEPGDDPAGWTMLADQLADLGQWGLDEVQVAEEPRPRGVRRRIHAHLVKNGRVDAFLANEGVMLSPTSYEAFLDGLELDYFAALHRLARRSAGDYGADKHASRFPEWTHPQARPEERAPTPKPRGRVTLTGIVDGWWKEALAANRSPRTLESYSGTVKRLVTFLGHDDAARVTPHDVIAYKDHRLAHVDPRTGKRLSAKTIKDSDLAALKAIFGWAVVNRLLPDNPAKELTVKVGKRVITRDPDFSEPEARLVLRTALHRHRGGDTERTHMAKRWVPWLCAYTGARVGEMAQLRHEDVRQVEGRWVVTITPEAGAVKTGERREVPLHEHLVALGFPDFVRASSPGHLFLKPAETGDVRGPLRGVTNRLREFVREEAGVTDEAVQPNHAWRHRFKRLTRELGLDAVTADAIQGHSTGTVSSAYGAKTLKAKAFLIDRIPRIEVPGDTSPNRSGGTASGREVSAVGG